jgi:hypothetical protein
VNSLAWGPFAALLVACAPGVVAGVPSSVPSVVLHGTDGARLPLDAALHQHPVTVITFFSADCPCQRAHDARLRALIAEDAPLGVGFLVVDSEERATAATDADESRQRGYPIWLDDAGRLARALGAEYATYSVVVDAVGKVLYRGGFDADRTHLRDDSPRFLADAVDDARAGRPIRRPEAKALGCSLQVK